MRTFRESASSCSLVGALERLDSLRCSNACSDPTPQHPCLSPRNTTTARARPLYLLDAPALDEDFAYENLRM